MFAISYRIINYTNELPIGADGYIRFDCGKYHYGEIFPPELDLVMDISSIYGWIQALIKAAELINEEIPYILIRDIESYNTYLQFRFQGNQTAIGIVRADHMMSNYFDIYRVGSFESQMGEILWEYTAKTQTVVYEIRRVATQYCDEIMQWPQNMTYVNELTDQIKRILCN